MCLGVAVAVAATLLPAAGAVPPDTAPILSDRLQLLADGAGKAVAAADTARLARALSLPPTGPGALVRDTAGRILVQARLTDTDEATRAALTRVATVLDVSDSMVRATLLIAPGDLDRLAALPAVTYVDLIPAPVTSAARDARPAAGCHPVVSEAVRAMRVRPVLRRGLDGSGVTVGVLSDSYDVALGAATYAKDDVRRGELPGSGNPCGRSTPVDVVDEYVADGTTPTDEGRAMLQQVHDVAPGARLMFATAGGGPDVFAANIDRLRRAGADVIVDDITYLTEPFFQQGVIDLAASRATRAGVVYVSSAGNSNVVLDGRDISSWETPTTRLGSCPTFTAPTGYGDVGTCVAFDAAATDTTYDLTVAPGGTLTPVVQWAEPFNGVQDDFDLFVIDPTTGARLASSTSVQARSQEPVEYLSWTNTSARARPVSIVVNRHTGTGDPRLKLVFVTMTGVTSLEHAVPAPGDVVGPTILGHNGGADVLSVAAVPYDDRRTVRLYSSRGPVVHYFGPVRGTTPAAPLVRPRVIRAPQVAAPDGTATSFFGPRTAGAHRFYGTSASAPAAAGVAALVRQGNPRSSPAQVRLALQRTARRVATADPQSVGAGLVNASRAVRVSRPPAVPVVTTTASRRGAVLVGFRAGAGGASAHRFQASCSRPTGAGAVTSSQPGRRPILVQGLRRGTTYVCRVRAVTRYGPGAWSAVGKPAVALGVPGRPRHVVAERDGRLAVLSFRPPANDGGRKVTRYTATCESADAPTRTASVRAGRTSTTVRKLRPAAAYRCTVQAENSLGRGTPSTPRHLPPA